MMQANFFIRPFYHTAEKLDFIVALVTFGLKEF